MFSKKLCQALCKISCMPFQNKFTKKDKNIKRQKISLKTNVNNSLENRSFFISPDTNKFSKKWETWNLPISMEKEILMISKMIFKNRITQNPLKSANQTVFSTNK